MTIPSYRLTETAPAAAEPLSLSEAKLHLRLDHDSDDALIAGLIAAARQICESVTGLSLISRGYSLFLDAWPGTSPNGWWDGIREGADIQDPARQLTLPRPPLLALSAVKTYDEAGNATTFAAGNYFIETGLPGRIVLKSGASAPLPGRNASGIEILFTAGYGASAAHVPAALRQGIRQIVAHLYEHRGDGAEEALSKSGAAALFQPFRLMRVQ